MRNDTRLTPLFRTASDGKLGRAWERGYQPSLSPSLLHLSFHSFPIPHFLPSLLITLILLPSLPFSFLLPPPSSLLSPPSSLLPPSFLLPSSLPSSFPPPSLPPSLLPPFLLPSSLTPSCALKFTSSRIMTLAKETEREKDAPKAREPIYLLLDLVQYT